MGEDGLLSLVVICAVAGLVSGVAKAFGMFLPSLRLMFALIFI